MAGHSKWHNIQHRKGAQDAKRGKLFTKLIREITVAAKMGDADPASNPRLRAAVDKALGNNMTKDTIHRAIKRGSGGGEGTDMAEIRYEGYGPLGIAVLVDCLTDNKNRTVAEVRHAFTKCGGNLGTSGSVAYLFTQTGMIYYEDKSLEDTLMEIALEAGADDLQCAEDGITVVTSPENYLTVKEALVAAGHPPSHAEVTMLASQEVNLTDEDNAQKLMRLTDMLEDLDDVQNVYSNADISDEVLEKL